MDNIDTVREEGFKDRSRWLAIVGLIEILIGGLCGLCGLFLSLFSRVLRQNPETANLLTGQMLLLSVLTFLALALFFMWLGIGTMRARRWARDLMLVTAWLWLIVGALSYILMFLVMYRMLLKVAASGPEFLSGGMFVAAMIINGIVLGFLYVILPGILVLFYGGRNVRKTFETRDPVIGWTSRCPLPALTVSQFLAAGGITLLLAPIYTNAVPFFGSLVTGMPGKLILILSGLLLCYLTWAIYKLKIHGWWINLLFTILGLVSLIPTFSKLDLTEYYAKGGLPLRQGDVIMSVDLPGGKTFMVILGILGMAWIGFLILIKKHFRKFGDRRL